jgi:hypothetical protein
MNPNLTWEIIKDDNLFGWNWGDFEFNNFSNHRYYKIGDTFIEKSKYLKSITVPVLERLFPIEIAEHIVSFI